MSRLGTHKTTVYQEDGWTKVRYHNTVVVMFNYKEIILNHGGWETNTTKTRMNQASQQFGLGYYIHQKDYIWHLTYGGKTHTFLGNMARIERTKDCVVQ